MRQNAEKVQGLLLDCDYTDSESSSTIRLFLRTGEGIRAFNFPGFNPYFYIITDGTLSEKKLQGLEFGEKKSKIIKAEKAGKEDAENAFRLSFAKVSDLTAAREEIKQVKGVLEKREHDISFAKRFLIDNALMPMDFAELELDSEGNALSARSFEKEHALKIASIDIETYSPGKFPNSKNDPIMMISLAAPEGAKVFSYGKRRLERLDYCKILSSEKAMLEAFMQELKLIQPDILVTYNGDSFDLPYIKERCKILGVDFSINSDRTEPSASRKGKDNAFRTKGIQHLDAFQLVGFLTRFQVINLIKYDLESVSEALLGKPKKKFDFLVIQEVWEKEKGIEELALYNREDAEAALEIVMKYMPLCVEVCKLGRMTLYDASRVSGGMLVEQFLIIKSFEQGLMVPNRPHEAEVNERMLSEVEGAFVKEPTHGLHENIAVIDFRSFHPTIIITHNISPETLDCKHNECAKGKNISPTGHYFCEKEKGFIPKNIEEVLKQRFAFKNEFKKAKKGSKDYDILFAKQWAFKIVLNAFFGYLGYPRSRWYCRECGNSILAWTRQYIKQTMQKAESEGFEVIYGDSITKERFVTIKDSNYLIRLKNIEELFEENKSKMIEINEKQIIPMNYLQTLSINPKTLKPEFCRINELIRHKNTRKIFRVNQKFGETIVTEYHSLMTKEGNSLIAVKPVEIGKKPLFKIREIPYSCRITSIDLAKELNYSTKIKYKGLEKTLSFKADNEWVCFGWMQKKEPIAIKRRINVNSKEFNALCRLCGAYIAEGSSSTPETAKSRIGASIASSNKEWLESLQKDYNLLFRNAKTCIIPATKKVRTLTYKNSQSEKTITYQDTTLKLQMMNSLSAAVFKQLCGQKSSGKKLPDFIFNAEKKFKKMMLDKIIEGDGSRKFHKKYSKEYIGKNYRIETKSLQLASGLSLLLTQLGQNHTIKYRPPKQTYTLTTSTKHNNIIMTKLMQERYSGFVYDLSTKNGNFADACGNILLHNTDSCMLKLNGKSNKAVEDFVEKINSEIPKPMVLELENFYKRGIFVTQKSGIKGAKKKYALIDFKDSLKIVGFEYVRRDWSNIAKQTQKAVIEAVLKEGNPEKAAQIVKKAVTELKEGKVKKKELIIYSEIQKPLGKYDIINPQVSAALKAQKKGVRIEVGTIVGYVITRSGKSISERAEMEEFVQEGNYDPDYYINNQILPAVERIMQELGYSPDDLKQGGKQARLF